MKTSQITDRWVDRMVDTATKPIEGGRYDGKTVNESLKLERARIQEKFGDFTPAQLRAIGL